MDDELIANFCAITGTDEQNAIHYLSAADGNLETAVSLFLDNTTANHATNTTANNNTATSMIEEEQVRAPIQQKRSVLIADDDSGINSNLGTNTGTNLGSGSGLGFSYVSAASSSRYAAPPIEPFRDFSLESPFISPSSAASPADERGRRLATLFRPPTEIMFPGGNFEQAKRRAKSEGKWLLVTLHCASEFPCQQMIRDVWNEATVQEFIRESLIFLFLTAGTSEAQRYQQYYPVEAYPHWALVDPRTGKRVKVGPARCINASEMLQELVEYVSDHPLPSSGTKRTIVIDDNEAAEGCKSQPINEGHNEEITRVSSDKKRPVHSPPPSAPLVANNEEEILSIPDEPAVDDKNATTLQIRMPDGSRHRRRFALDGRVLGVLAFIQRVGGLRMGQFEVFVGAAPSGDGLISGGARERSLSEMNLKNVVLTVTLTESPLPSK